MWCACMCVWMRSHLLMVGVNNLVMVRGCTQRDIRLRVPFHRRLGCLSGGGRLSQDLQECTHDWIKVDGQVQKLIYGHVVYSVHASMSL